MPKLFVYILSENYTWQMSGNDAEKCMHPERSLKKQSKMTEHPP